MSSASILSSRISDLFLVLTVVPWDYPNLSNKSATTSPFTIVFRQFGSSALHILLALIFVFISQPPLHPL